MLQNATGYDYEGPVMIKLDGTWSLIQNNGIQDITTVHTICRLLGFGYGTAITGHRYVIVYIVERVFTKLLFLKNGVWHRACKSHFVLLINMYSTILLTCQICITITLI